MDMKAMMQQAQQLQKQVEQIKAEINASKFTSVQAGVVTVIMFGTKKISSVEIDDSIMDDKEMLQDLITVAVNDCVKQIEDYTEEKMGRFGPGLGGLL